MSLYHTIRQDRVPASGYLVIPGHTTVGEIAVLRKMFAGRPITWLIEEKTKLHGDIEKAIQGDKGAMISQEDKNPLIAGKQLQQSLDKNGVIIYLGQSAKARSATPCHVPSRTLKTLCSLGLPVLPIAVDHPREGNFEIESDGSLPQGVLCVGALIAAENVSVASYREALLLAFEEAYSQRAFLNQNLGTLLIRGLKKYGKTGKIVDGADDSALGYDKVLASAIVLADYLKKETDQPRVGIVLPPGRAGLIANIAVVLAGKVPVNLNFTASQESVRSSMRQAGLDRFITVDPFVRKFPSFPWPPNRDLILVERVLPPLKSKIGLWLLLTRLMPASAIAAKLGILRVPADREAVLLFTSGSSGEPKGVSLTHRNVLANEIQFHSRLGMQPQQKILGCLPLFHSFGCTVTLWYPILAGLDLVTYTSPLDTKRLAELIHQRQVNLLLSTPTFLRGFMKRIEAEQLSSLKLVVTGAEKLPSSLADAFEEKFGIRPQEGYGLTETSPATNVNLPNLSSADDAELLIASSRSGTVGHLLPGIAIRMTNAATEQPVSIDQQGLIWLRGANVFQGYLNNPKKSAEVLQNGWFLTGDVGRMDDDGFLIIEGRISRFSKIGGEMVPHETLETSIMRCLGIETEAERRIAVVGVPDAQKGEAIVLLSTMAGMALEQECIDLRYKLMDEGIPSLWCPKRIVKVKDIPILASGKLDIKGCEALAQG